MESSTGLGSTTLPNPTASPALTTTYIVIATDSLGCTATDNVIVTVNPNPTITITPNPASVCAGSSIALTASGEILMCGRILPLRLQ